MTKDYRDEALAARRAARARLKEFRAARLAKRGISSATAVAPAPEDPTESPFTVDPDLLYGAPASTDASQPLSEILTRPDTGPHPSEDDSATPGSTDHFTASGDGPNTPLVTDTTDPSTPVPGTSTGAASNQGADLALLPCAGDGMVLLFNQCGIHSLADLATADATDLSQRLGIIGQILDLSPWIDYARKHINALSQQTGTP